MRGHYFRIRTRTLLGLVALAALAFAAIDGWNRSALNRWEARRHEAKLQHMEGEFKRLAIIRQEGRTDTLRFAYADCDRFRCFCFEHSPTNPSLLGLSYDDYVHQVRRRISYHRRMAILYRWGSVFPWLSIHQEPSPPSSVGFLKDVPSTGR